MKDALSVILLTCMLAACGDDHPSTEPDGGVDASGSDATCKPTTIEFFGTRCTEDPYPAITVCHHVSDDPAAKYDGVCYQGTCYPLCLPRSAVVVCDGHELEGDGRGVCPQGTRAFTAEGICVCTP